MTSSLVWRGTKSVLFYLLIAVIVVYAVFPFYYAILTSFKSGTALFKIDYWPTSFSIDNYLTVMTKGNFPLNLLNSLVVSVSVVIISLLLAITAAFALSRVRFRGRPLLLLVILSVSMFPSIAVLAGLFEVIRVSGLYNSAGALIFSYMIFTLPFTVWVLTTFMRDLPLEIEEAAMSDGATRFGAMVRVIFPLAGPGLAATAIFSFIAAWNEFLFALTFLKKESLRTLPVALSAFVGQEQADWGLIMAASVLFTVPVVIFFLAVHRRLTTGMVAGSVTG